MKPIVLDCATGVTLREEFKDEDELSSSIGVHDICRGFVDIRPISKTHNALVCRACHFWKAIPKEVNTYGKLREYCRLTKVGQ